MQHANAGVAVAALLEDASDVWGLVASHANGLDDFINITSVNRAARMAKSDPLVVADFFYNNAGEEPAPPEGSDMRTFVFNMFAGRSLRALVEIIKCTRFFSAAVRDAAADILIKKVRAVARSVNESTSNAAEEGVLLDCGGDAFNCAWTRGRTYIVRQLLLNSSDFLERYWRGEFLAPHSQHMRVQATLLMQAAWKGHYDLVELALQRKRDCKVDEAIADVHYSGFYHTERAPTALAWACFTGHVNIVNLLLQSGARALLNSTALRLAVNGRLCSDHDEQLFALVQSLLGHGAADPNDIVLRLLARRGKSAEIVRLLLEARPDKSAADVTQMLWEVVPQTQRYQKDEAEHDAPSRVAILELLIGAGALIDRPYPMTDVTALMCASQRCSKGIVLSLLNHGASATLSSVDGGTALHYLARSGHARDSSMKLDTVLTIANALIRAGADIECKHDGRTPLMYAAAAGKVRVISALLRQGANVNGVGAYDKTPLMCASTAPAVAALVKAGADPHAIDLVRQRTPLMHAIGQYDLDNVVKAHIAAILKHKKNPDDSDADAIAAALEQRDALEMTALMIAAKENSNPRVIMGLIDMYPNGAQQVHAPTGQNLLMLAASGFMMVLQALAVRFPWNLGAQDLSGKTAFQLARDAHKTGNVVRMLQPYS